VLQREEIYELLITSFFTINVEKRKYFQHLTLTWPEAETLRDDGNGNFCHNTD
jgi:hypothetical protein